MPFSSKEHNEGILNNVSTVDCLNNEMQWNCIKNKKQPTTDTFFKIPHNKDLEWYECY